MKSTELLRFVHVAGLDSVAYCWLEVVSQHAAGTGVLRPSYLPLAGGSTIKQHQYTCHGNEKGGLLDYVVTIVCSTSCNHVVPSHPVATVVFNMSSFSLMLKAA